MKKRKKSKINISELLRKHRAGKSIGSTNRARLVARGLIARKSGPHKGKKIDLGEEEKIMPMHKKGGKRGGNRGGKRK